MGFTIKLNYIDVYRVASFGGHLQKFILWLKIQELRLLEGYLILQDYLGKKSKN